MSCSITHGTSWRRRTGRRRRTNGWSTIEEDGITGFYRASAYEGLAKAPSVAGEREKNQEYIELAKAEVRHLTDEEERKVLFDELAEIPEYG